MPDAKTLLGARLQSGFDQVQPGADPVLRPTDRADYQANGALALAKSLGRNPRELAEEILASIDLSDLCESAEVSGPGFINLSFSRPFLADQIGLVAQDERLGVPLTASPGTIVIDYSGPNVAKEMHVGHLRSTVIGDSLCRILDFVGHRVVRENHIGDWGTNFGMLIEHLIDEGVTEGARDFTVSDLNDFYRAARGCFDADEGFAERSRRRVVLLQSGDEETLALWRLLIAESLRHCDEVYERLGVLLTDDDVVGESFYNPMLPSIVAELTSKGLLVESDGALCVFPPGFTNRNGDPLPLIVQKSDGGYGYAATDLASLRDRAERIAASEVLYVVGSDQAQHLSMCFAVAQMAGWLQAGMTPVHVGFGLVLGADRNRFASRTGDAVKLTDLLDEAVERAGRAAAERTEDLEDRFAIARQLGIGAVKYSDLATDRLRDYAFDFDRMLAFEGSTGPYLQYAHARICSIFRRGEVATPGPETTVILEHPSERALALELLGFADALDSAIETSSPHKLCAYLFALASTYTTFYENCPVLKAPDEVTRNSRLFLCALSARILSRGLSLLGIEAPEHM
jgi:arginyl-tRNA synthetase